MTQTFHWFPPEVSDSRGHYSHPRQPGPTTPAPAWLAPLRFHCPAREWTLEGDVRLPVQEGAQLSAAEYRRRLHQVLRDATRVIRAPRPPLRSDPAPTPTAL